MIHLLLTLCLALTSQADLNLNTADVLEAHAGNVLLLADPTDGLSLGSLALAKGELSDRLLRNGALGGHDLLALPLLGSEGSLLALGSALALQGELGLKAPLGLDLFAVPPADKGALSLGSLALAKGELSDRLLRNGALGGRDLLGLSLLG